MRRANFQRLSDTPLIYRWLIAGLLTAVVVWLSSIPGYGSTTSKFGWIVELTPGLLQKTMHLVLYASLAILWIWALEEIGSKSTRFILVVVLIVSLGSVLEWYQTLIPGRYGTISDVLLNALGVLIGVIVAFAIL